MVWEWDIPNEMLVGQDLTPQLEELMWWKGTLVVDVEICGMVWIRCRMVGCRLEGVEWLVGCGTMVVLALKS